MKKISLLTCSLAACFFSVAQSLMGNDAKIISERTFIHTDKSTCIAGDTIWYKVYLFDGYQPGSTSTNLIVELIDEQSRLIAQQKLPVFEATASGFFAIGDSLAHGFYFLRAYTSQMVASQQSIASKLISVLNPGYIPQKYIQQAPIEYKMQFYPESENLIAGLTNTVAFKMTDQYGNGIDIPILISNATGDTVAFINSTQNGMETFSFVPVANEKYFASIKSNTGENKKFELPVAQYAGVLLNIAENSKGKVYLVQKSPDLLKNEKTELRGVMFDNIVFRQPLKFDSNESSGVIPLSNLPSGVLHLSVINENEQVLAFRPVIITKADQQASILFNKDTVSFSPKAKNIFSIQLPDTAEGNFSVSVIAMNPSNMAIGSNSILHSILINPESGLPAVEQTSFNNSRDKNDLQALTGKWKQPLLKKQNVAITDNYISVSGKVFKYGSKKLVTKGTLLMYLQTKDSLNTFLKAPIGDDGSAKLDGLVFDDSARFNYQSDEKEMGKVELTIEPPNENKALPFAIPKDLMLPIDKILITKQEVKEELTAIKTYIEKTKESYKLLERVTVKAVRKRPVDIINKKYTTGLFSSMVGNVHALELISDPPQSGAQNILQYLQGRMVGLRIVWKGGNKYIITSTRSALLGGETPVHIFLNEIEVEANALLNINIRDVALVKYFQSGTNTMVGFGVGGKLAVYTKQVDDYSPAELGQYNFFYVEGYTPTKEFTQPDYSNGIHTNEDKRQTLYWNPDMYITADQRQVKIRFFNSDNVSKFKIVIQGYTYDGRFIDFEKIIE